MMCMAGCYLLEQNKNSVGIINETETALLVVMMLLSILCVRVTCALRLILSISLDF